MNPVKEIKSVTSNNLYAIIILVNSVIILCISTDVKIKLFSLNKRTIPSYHYGFQMQLFYLRIYVLFFASILHDATVTSSSLRRHSGSDREPANDEGETDAWRPSTSHQTVRRPWKTRNSRRDTGLSFSPLSVFRRICMCVCLSVCLSLRPSVWTISFVWTEGCFNHSDILCIITLYMNINGFNLWLPFHFLIKS